MQETIAEQLVTHNNFFVDNSDVPKAFDGICINELFHRLHSLGIKGKHGDFYIYVVSILPQELGYTIDFLEIKEWTVESIKDDIFRS